MKLLHAVSSSIAGSGFRLSRFMDRPSGGLAEDFFRKDQSILGRFKEPMAPWPTSGTLEVRARFGDAS